MSYSTLAYDITEYPGFREHGGTRVRDARLWGYVQVDNVPEPLRGQIALMLAEYAATLGDQETRLNATGANMRLMWTVRDSGPIVSQAQISRYEGEAAGGVAYVRWGGGR